MGFQPQDAGTIEQKFGFFKLNLTYGPVFARAKTDECCLLLISAWTGCLYTLTQDSLLQDSEIRNRAVKQSLNTRRLIPASRGSKGMKTSIGSPEGYFQQSGGSLG